jgi:hypothetical protein
MTTGDGSWMAAIAGERIKKWNAKGGLFIKECARDFLTNRSLYRKPETGMETEYHEAQRVTCNLCLGYRFLSFLLACLGSLTIF